MIHVVVVEEGEGGEAAATVVIHVVVVGGGGGCFVFVGWLLIVPATCECISGTDLHRQFDVLPH